MPWSEEAFDRYVNGPWPEGWTQDTWDRYFHRRLSESPAEED